jgi:hypothetical protein
MDTKLLLPIWVFGSMSLYAVATSMLYRNGGRLDNALSASSLGGLLHEIGTLLFNIGIPFVAMLLGVVSFDLLGLGKLSSSVDHVAGFTLDEWLRGTGGLLGAVALVWVVMRQSRSAITVSSESPSGYSLVRNAMCDEAHWMFYRAPATLFLSDAFLGASIGFALVVFEWLLNPRFIPTNFARPNRWSLLIRLMCAITSGALYLGTQNLWLMIAAHIVIAHTGSRLVQNVLSRKIKLNEQTV